jgi:TetR/AcrR family transcriptional repressor of nem operon
MTTETKQTKKDALIEAAIGLILKQGYNATSVDEICAAAGVTKGTYFHYFKSKEDMGLAAIEAWMAGWKSIVDQANLEAIPDPLDRVWALLGTMETAYSAFPGGSGCVLGSVAQELSRTSDRVREKGHETFGSWVEITSKLLSDAKAAHTPKVDFDPDQVAWWLQSFVQGTLLIAKSHPDQNFISQNISHCRAYIEFLFGKA